MSESLTIPASIIEIEKILVDLPQTIMPVNHVFTPGMISREIMIPADTILTSMMHKTEHQFLVVQGVIDVISETEKTRYVAPYLGITPAGTKRALHAITDTIWITFHPNPDNITDVVAFGESILATTGDPSLEGWRASTESWQQQLTTQ